MFQDVAGPRCGFQSLPPHIPVHLVLIGQGYQPYIEGLRSVQLRVRKPSEVGGIQPFPPVVFRICSTAREWWTTLLCLLSSLDQNGALFCRNSASCICESADRTDVEMAESTRLHPPPGLPEYRLMSIPKESVSVLTAISLAQ